MHALCLSFGCVCACAISCITNFEHTLYCVRVGVCFPFTRNRIVFPCIQRTAPSTTKSTTTIDATISLKRIEPKRTESQCDNVGSAYPQRPFNSTGSRDMLLSNGAYIIYLSIAHSCAIHCNNFRTIYLNVCYWKGNVSLSLSLCSVCSDCTRGSIKHFHCEFALLTHRRIGIETQIIHNKLLSIVKMSEWATRNVRILLISANVAISQWKSSFDMIKLLVCSFGFDEIEYVRACMR